MTDMPSDYKKISKFLSYVLRHQPEAIGITLDTNGWVNIETLLYAANQRGQRISRDTLQAVVETNDKKRFSISDDLLRIRAAQGHSTRQVDLEYAPVQPPKFLYHGTATRFLMSIQKQGLLSGSRQYVHLSADEMTARQVGVRHGMPVILLVQAEQMWDDGHVFHLADNGVWLAKAVPVAYLEKMK